MYGIARIRLWKCSPKNNISCVASAGKESMGLQGLWFKCGHADICLPVHLPHKETWSPTTRASMPPRDMAFSSGNGVRCHVVFSVSLFTSLGMCSVVIWRAVCHNLGQREFHSALLTIVRLLGRVLYHLFILSYTLMDISCVWLCVWLLMWFVVFLRNVCMHMSVRMFTPIYMYMYVCILLPASHMHIFVSTNTCRGWS